MNLQEFLAQHWEMLLARVHGPLTFRLILQPLAAVILAIRSGIADAHEGRPPLLQVILTDSTWRTQMLHLMWEDIGRVFAVAVAIDVIYQLIVYRQVYPVQALVVAVILALIPYTLVRGPIGRIARRYIRRVA
jgi:hypothetical protein